MNSVYRFFLATVFVSTLAMASTGLKACSPNDNVYAVVVKKATADNEAWNKVVQTLQTKHNAVVITYENSVDESLADLKREFPRHTCFVATVEDAGREFVAKVHQLTRKLDDDPYTDTFWGILTGYDPKNALEIALHHDPLTINRVASGTEFATTMVTEGQWFDELVKNKHVLKESGATAIQHRGPDDTTKSLVDALNVYKPDLFITSGHATERNWQIGFRFRSGQFLCKEGGLYGLDLNRNEHPIHSPNAKVYMPIGNCLMGHIKDRDAMALAWMNSAGVKQMIGYTIPTGYGYGGWGCLDYFVEQPGRYTFNEAFFANHHALIHRINSPDTPTSDRRRLGGDRDVVAFYGDPKWSAKMAERPKYYQQSLTIKDGVYSLTVTPNRGEDSFKPVNLNGSERGWRPIIQYLPHRIKGVTILDGAKLNPTISDDFILIPNPRTCDPNRSYVVRFTASKSAQ